MGLLHRRLLLMGFIVLLLSGGLFQAANFVTVRAQVPNATEQAQQTATEQARQEEEGSPRLAKLTVSVNLYKWWVIRWSNNQIQCSVWVEHEGFPSLDEVETQCGQPIAEDWADSKPCNLAGVADITQCPGVYLVLVETRTEERQLEVELPKPQIYLSIENCTPPPDGTGCTQLPNLVLTGEEPLPNEVIISIQGTLAGEPFSCMGSLCSLALKPTGLDGSLIQFWGDSSFGDSSKHYTARVRLIPWGGFMNPEQPRSNEAVHYYLDVLSSQWRGGEVASCSETWQVFPEISGPPIWLTSPQNTEDLRSDVSYYYLAGALITYGAVDASACLDGGLQAPSIASPCGVEAARPQLQEWQNRFDEEIMQASQDTGIPARLLKNVFSRESQLWPGIYRTYRETGLGQMTENGADTILLWNPDFFHQFCPLVLDKSTCDLGYGNLEPSVQNMLRGALVRKVDASCPDCPVSIDLSQANVSVNIFAEGMLANCEQVGRIINNVTNLSGGETSSYDDLWRFTLVNYNAGPGCLSNAIEKAWSANQPLDWRTVSGYFEPVCQAAIGYVEDISMALKATPTPTVWLPNNPLLPTPIMPRVRNSPTPSLTPTPIGITSTVGPNATRTPTPSRTPGTGTPGDYPPPQGTDDYPPPIEIPTSSPYP